VFSFFVQKAFDAVQRFVDDVDGADSAQKELTGSRSVLNFRINELSAKNAAIICELMSRRCGPKLDSQVRPS